MSLYVDTQYLPHDSVGGDAPEVTLRVGREKRDDAEGVAVDYAWATAFIGIAAGVATSVAS